jgi:hypothetical protein
VRKRVGLGKYQVPARTVRTSRSGQLVDLLLPTSGRLGEKELEAMATENRTAGKDPGAATSVETLIARQRSASTARAAELGQHTERRRCPVRDVPANDRWQPDEGQLEPRWPVAILVAPVRPQHFDYRANRWFIMPKHFLCVFVHTRAPVRIPSGSSAHTLTPKEATSWARASVNPPTAHLAAWYAVLPGSAKRPPTDDT